MMNRPSVMPMPVLPLRRVFIYHHPCIFILLLLVCWSGLAQAELNTRLNAGRISMGDTVQLQIEAADRLVGPASRATPCGPSAGPATAIGAAAG